MAIVKINDHAERATARLLTQLRESVSHRGLLNAASRQVQEIENAFYAVLVTRQIDNAGGAQLDGIGRLVGQPREGRIDTVYRLWIKARILVNKRSGEVETLAQIVNQIVPGSVARVLEFFPASIELQVNAVTLTDADAAEANKLVQLAKAGGVRLVLVYLPVASASLFTLNGGPGQGLGDTNDLSTGGHLAGAIS